MRSGLRALLAYDPRIQVAAEAATLAGLLEQEAELDVVLLAEELPLAQLAEALAASEEPPALLLLSQAPEAAQPIASLPARAWGWLPPDCSPQELAAAVLALHEGLIAAAPPMLTALLAPANRSEAPLDEELTERELDVLQLLAEGMANKQIALQLNISEHTVKFHSSSIYAKLGVTNRTEAVRRAARLGLLVL
ncbi:MAG: response regulator transcription factor [Anaerolineales bacterium]|nr:response regulator transcription factor [Anaerolineales bacterium]